MRENIIQENYNQVSSELPSSLCDTWIYSGLEPCVNKGCRYLSFLKLGQTHGAKAEKHCMIWKDSGVPTAFSAHLCMIFIKFYKHGKQLRCLLSTVPLCDSCRCLRASRDYQGWPWIIVPPQRQTLPRSKYWVETRNCCYFYYYLYFSV